MARICENCGKGPKRANKVSHSNIKTPRRQKPNLQFKTIGNSRMLICTRCLKTFSKNK